MKIFISWSGQRSRLFAKALREWLPLVIHYAEPWLSDTDISAGDRWSSEVAHQLEQSNFGVLCLTRDNASSPWILFEAGALGKFMDTSAVCPYLLDLEFSDLAGPLSQYQAKKSDKSSSFALVESINKRSANALSSDILNELFEALWPRLEERISEIPAQAEATKSPKKTHDVIETLVAGFMRLENKMNNIEDSIAEIQFRQEVPEAGLASRSTVARSMTVEPTDATLHKFKNENTTVVPEDESVDYLIRVFNETKREDGWADIAYLGHFLSEYTPVEYKSYGYRKLREYLESTGLFEFNQVSKTKLEVALLQ